ncbi:hypothetical protein GCM10023172_01370 [Hymenobacter ginsengisoli]|uniref:Uncharacterized protein n=1 Tax=Hymenobacter ginsengisoli TaxID=1051626 RepID=A0ABP8PTZ2_9BACT|nr:MULTISPECIES: hypothetical protein [unclassified Hymenobacter]MBO2033532.1 hypothetical protein [Hymenobacter sp. BT559]
MRIAYFSDYQLPVQAGRWRILPGSAVDRRAGQAQDWQDELTRHQVIYEELLANSEWASNSVPPTPAPRQRALSARDLTRDLAGWSPPQPGGWRAAKR